jgi:hypothetical protein
MLAALVANVLVLGACAGHAGSSVGRASQPQMSATRSNEEAVPGAPTEQQTRNYSSEDESEDELVAGEQGRPDRVSLAARTVSTGGGELPPSPPLIALADATKAGPQPAPAQPSQTGRVDAVHTGPLLIYTATFQLHVYEVEKAQLELKAAAKRLGGFVSEQTDTSLTLRVPSARFEEALAAVESTGKVRARHMQALDVGDEYRDLTLRLRTAEALHDRLETMLAHAAKVDEALQVEKELERIVREIEHIKGRLRAMGDRIALSTVTVDFRPEARPDLDDSDAFRLPYAWLEELGLHHLLELTP